MRFRIQLITFSLLTFLFSFFFAKNALAANYNLIGSVKDNTGSAIAGATVSVNDINADSTITDSSGNYSLSIPQGTYNIQVTPQSGSTFTSTAALNQNISSDTVLNFILVAAGTIQLSGHFYDSANNPLPGLTIYLVATDGSSPTHTTTDSSGYYSLQAATGTYHLDIHSGSNNNNTLLVPTHYYFDPPNTSYSQSVIQDFHIPSSNVSIHVQNTSGSPINNVNVSTGASQTISLGGGVSASGYNSGSPNTDNNGNATMLLFPGANSYTFTAVPPAGSGYSQGTLNNVSVTGNTNITITLQYQPITVSGHLYDSVNSPLPGVQVYLVGLDGSTDGASITDSNGYYSFSTTQGTYHLDIHSGSNNNNTLLVPTHYYFDLPNTPYTQNTTQNVIIPSSSVSIHVQDWQGNAISNVNVSTGASEAFPIGGGIAATGFNSGSPNTDSSGNATIFLFPGSNPYTFAAVPPVGSGYSQSNSGSITVNGSTSVTITLQKPITISGTIIDALNNPLPGLQVYLVQGSTTVASTSTNSSGNYSIQVNAGSYNLGVHSGNNNNNSLLVPLNYYFQLPTTSYNQNTVQNITIPASRVNLHVEDQLSNPIANVVVSVGGVEPITVASGVTIYANNSGTVTTNSSGDAAIFLFSGASPYTFNAIPPNGSIYSQVNLNNVIVSGDQTELISLQYNHTTPVTTINLSTLYPDGTYSDPATVTLLVTYPNGYGPGNTYYTIDNPKGSPIVYTSPFAVSGGGSHTITYWSVDNTGVPEAPNTKTFTITEAYNLSGTVYVDENQNGVQDSGEPTYQGVSVALNTGQTITTDSNGNYTFGSIEAGSYTETMTLPTGFTATTANPVTVPLSQDTTENFGIVPQAPTIGTITVNTDPVQINTAVSASSTFTEPIANPQDTAVWNWGDNSTSSGVITEPMGSTSGSVSGSHIYSAAGVYTVTLQLKDQYGISSTQTFQYVSVYSPTNQGVFSAGQQLISVAGDYPQNPSLTGTVKFGLVYKYSGGMPVGDRQFMMTFKAANFSFNATTITALVISNGTATLIGTGTINGSGTYNFAVVGVNNSDVRIQITDPSNNSAVIFDTQPGAALTDTPTTPVTGQVIVN